MRNPKVIFIDGYDIINEYMVIDYNDGNEPSPLVEMYKKSQNGSYDLFLSLNEAGMSKLINFLT